VRFYSTRQLEGPESDFETAKFGQFLLVDGLNLLSLPRPSVLLLYSYLGRFVHGPLISESSMSMSGQSLYRRVMLCHEFRGHYKWPRDGEVNPMHQ
jgi:hypothetical protein